jgi:multiple sugar transport system permease protein
MESAMKMRKSGIAGKSSSTAVFIYIVLFIFAALCIVPFWMLLVNATRSNQEINLGVSMLPGASLVENAKSLVLGRVDGLTGERMQGIDVPRGFLNSFVIAICSTVLTAYFGIMTAYGFALYRFRGRKILFGIVMGVIMIPSTVNLIGVYKLALTLKMIDTWWPLILPAIANPFAVFFLKNYLEASLPRSLVEAARIDGSSEYSIFHTIAIPLASPAIATISIFGFLGVWNSYLIPLIIINSNTLYTLPMMIQQLNTTTFNRDLGALYFGIAISIVPILVAFAFFSRYLVEGISMGGVKE